MVIMIVYVTAGVEKFFKSMIELKDYTCLPLGFLLN